MKILRSIIVLFVIFLLLPITVFAKSDYKDILGPKINYESDKVTIYLFYMDGCSHCAAEKVFLKELSDKYPDLNVVYYDVYTYDNYYQEAQKLFDLNINSVPFTIVGEEYYLGFSKGGLVEENITDQIKHYFSDSEHKDDFTKKYSIPLLGNINPKKASIPLVAIILGLIDGFNPCAMWVLLFLLTILINAKDRKKMLIIGSIFLFTSGLIYYLSILGINIILGIKAILRLRSILGGVAIVVGLYNLYKFIKKFKETGCEIVDDKKRKTILQKTNKILITRNIFLIIIGVATLAISVNLIEMACSLGFPTIFSEIMALNNIKGLNRLLLILLYTIFYMLDDIIVFIISIISLKLIGTSNRVAKVIKFISALIMITMGILLIFFPDIIMLNF